MDPYTICLLLGGLGLVAMAVSGVGHGQSGARAHVHAGGRAHLHAGGSAHVHGGARHAAQPGGRAGHPGAARGGGHGTHGAVGRAGSRALWALMSPRVFFSVLLGVGTTGVLLRQVTAGPLLLVGALAGGALFELAIARPVWNSAMRFASKPAMTLESCVMDAATVVTSFDANGQGLVAVELDGQIVQVLATLLPAERREGVTVRAGDLVRIDAVDAERNRCTVSLT